MTSDLTQKKCTPCEGGTAPLTKEEAREYLSHLDQWELRGDVSSIQRTTSFNNFKEALEFVNDIGAVAESEGHHPDILLHGYKHVSITLTTHAIGGLSENDFILAAKIDSLLEE